MVAEPPKPPNVYSPRTLALDWGCSERHIRNLINEGELRAWRLGKLLRINVQEVEDFKHRNLVADIPEKAQPPPVTRVSAVRLDMPPKLRPVRPR